MKLRIMADFCSSGIWDMDNDGMMLEYDELKLPEDLTKEFKDWIQFYDKSFEGEYNHIKKGSDYLNSKGRHLAHRIKKLFPDIVVTYWGEDERDLLDPVEIL